ncbi:alpha-2 adrenergic receptor [Trichonephila clavipes]|nr:alpha-2 adrenergic receptor [Trichonephila clavipes]
MIPPAHKAHQTVSFSGYNGVSTYTCGLASNAAVRFIAKQNSLVKIGNNGNLVLGPFDESTPCLMIVLMNCQTKLRINHLTAVKSVAILEIPRTRNSARKTFGPTDLTSTYSVCTRRMFGGTGIEPRPSGPESGVLTTRPPTA